MTLTLILTRHAKSDWDDPRLDDFDRPLNRRGRASARAMGTWLAAQGHVPDEVILSGAARTVETWALMGPAFGRDIPVRTDRALYHASDRGILDVLRTARAPVTMLIGHNPGMAEFAQEIVAAAPDHPRFADYPTCATAVIRFARDRWTDAGWGDGSVADFAVPRDLG